MFRGGGPVFKGTVYALEDLNSVPGNHRGLVRSPRFPTGCGAHPSSRQLYTILLSYIHASICLDAVILEQSRVYETNILSTKQYVLSVLRLLSRSLSGKSR
jgi:hypothetical protein